MPTWARSRCKSRRSRLNRVVETVTYAGSMFTLEEAKDELGIVDTGVASLDAKTDSQVTAKIAVVQRWCEDIVYRTYGINVARTLKLNRWPDEDRIRFDAPPLIAVTGITYLDEDEVAVPLDPSNYEVYTPTDLQGYLRWKEEFDRPALAVDRDDAVTIAYTSGYTDVANIPDTVKEAAWLMLSRYWDDNRELSVLESYERAAEALMRGEDWGDV